MSLDHAQFEALVHRMEKLASDRPGLYRARMLGLALLGYGYLLAVIVGILILLALSVFLLLKAPLLALKAGLILVPLLWVILRSLWVRLHAPEGVRITADEAPALFAVLDRLRERLNTPPIHVVLVTPDLNAGITQIPRLGLFGWHRNYLILGMALMKSLTVEQLESVLAHELGHLSRGHARMGNWIYRTRRVWQQLEQALEGQAPSGAGIVRNFFKWYVPHFAACSYPLARRNEFEADAASISATSARAAAQALTNTSVMAHYLSERYWPGIHAKAREVVQPAFAPYREMNVRAREGLTNEDAQRWLASALARKTTYDDTHPCLAERLAAMRAQAEVALPDPNTAADTLFGAEREILEQRFDQEWLDNIRPSWRQAYEQASAERQRLEELRARAATEPLSVEESLQLANVEESVGAGADAAFALRRAVLEREPESALARFAVGRQLVLRDDVEGVALLQKAIESSLQEHPRLALAGAELLRNFWWAKGDRQLAQRWHDYLVTNAQGLQKQDNQRAHDRLQGEWIAHDMNPESLAKLLARLRTVRGLKRAFLARAASVAPSDPPLYILGFGVQRFGYLSSSTAQRVMNELCSGLGIDEPTLIVHAEANQTWMQRKFKSIRGSRIL